LPPGPSTTVPRVGRFLGLTREYGSIGIVEAYLGVPYAKPPVGDLRFASPHAIPEVDTIEDFDATKFPASCYQTINAQLDRKFTLHIATARNISDLSEDCLYLNVWKSQEVMEGDSKAVMVFIHGGGFYSGTSSLDVLDGSVLAFTGGVVVVSLNYRVGPLGFLTVDDPSAPGNVGLLDQQLALRWVHDHIAAFGGDPTRVTLFGQSSGGASVGYHLLSPGSASLFRSAIIESTGPTGPYVFMDRDEITGNAMKLIEKAGCYIKPFGRVKYVNMPGMLRCLRSLDAATVTNLQWAVPVDGPAFQQRFLPTVDDTFLSRPPRNVVDAGDFQRKSLLLGSNSDEGSSFLFMAFPNRFNPNLTTQPDITDDDFASIIAGMNPLNPSQLAAAAFEYAFPSCRGAAADRFVVLSNVLGDRVMKSGLVSTARAYADKSVERGANFSVYMYAFDHRDTINEFPAWSGRAFHGDELSYVFGLPFQDPYFDNYTDDDRTLSSQMISYWTNFAKTRDPNRNDDASEMADHWPPYTPTEHDVFVLDTTPRLQAATGRMDRLCDFWTELVPQLGVTPTTTSSGVGCAPPILLMLFAVLVTMWQLTA